MVKVVISKRNYIRRTEEKEKKALKKRNGK